jgi:hypothetical protein
MRLLNRNDADFETFCETTLPTLHGLSEVMAWGDEHGFRFSKKGMNILRNRLRRMNDRNQRRSAQRDKRIGRMPESGGPRSTCGLRS